MIAGTVARGTGHGLSDRLEEMATKTDQQPEEEEVAEVSVVGGDLFTAGLHELRRPIALARGYLEMVQEGSLGYLNGAQRRALERVQHKLTEARALLDRFDTTVRLEAHQLDPQPLELQEEVQRAVRRGDARAELLGGSVELGPLERRVSIVADRVLLQRILDNLIDNALTYSDLPRTWRSRMAFIPVHGCGCPTGDLASTRRVGGGCSSALTEVIRGTRSAQAPALASILVTGRPRRSGAACGWSRAKSERVRRSSCGSLQRQTRRGHLRRDQTPELRARRGSIGICQVLCIKTCAMKTPNAAISGERLRHEVSRRRRSQLATTGRTRGGRRMGSDRIQIVSHANRYDTQLWRVRDEC